ncbi:MAG TPA: monovalent cation:proton antiporter-2 (CPA2) family protein [Magnetospirillum sp.]|nr:monovalent cation:proton antiporter-2 (CPA2) family protein [Magnetospirillum sp.]
MNHGILSDALIFLTIAVLVSPVCHRLRLSPVLGYLLAGSVVGPAGLGLMADEEGARDLAELGIVFLLFMIGLELSWERLRVIRHFIFGLGTAQVVVTGVLAAGMMAAMGLGMNGAGVVGVALAFSSTAFVLQILSERGELNSQVGRVAVAVLILQDLAVVPLLVTIPQLGGAGLSLAWAELLALAKAVAAMAAIFLVARLALRPLFHVVSATRSPDVFVAAALLTVVGTSFATEAAGLSLSLGAFLAGVMLASTEYRHQVEADLQPVRGLLMGLFFLTVGMTVDPAKVVADLPAIANGVALLVGGKALVLTVLALLFRFPLSTALHLGLLLAQGGEFAFVALARAGQAHLLSPAEIELLTSVVAVSMAATPALAALGDWVARRHRLADAQAVAPGRDCQDLAGHVIIVGFGRAGQVVATILRELGIPFVAIDRDPRLVARLRDGGDDTVFFGDIRKVDVLKAVGAARARAVLLTIDTGSGREKLVPRLRTQFPELHILVRARDRRQARGLESAGATAVVPEILEGSLQLAGLTLRHLGLPPDEVHGLIDDYRRADYAKLTLTIDRE